MRATTHSMALVPPPLAPGQRLRDIVSAAVKQRRHLTMTGKGQAADVSRLQLWLERNPFPSEKTVRAFPLMGDLVGAMPKHENGRKMLDEARQLTAYRPNTNTLNHR